MDARKALYKVLLVGAGTAALFKLASALVDKKEDISDLLSSNVYASEAKAEGTAEASVPEKSLDESIREMEAKANKTAEDYIKLSDLYDIDTEIKKYEVAVRKALELDPNNSMAHSNIGVLYKKQGKIDKAEKEYKLAISLDKNNASAYNNLSALYGDKLKDYDKEMEFAIKAIELDAENPLYYYGLAKAYSRKGRKYMEEGKNSEAKNYFEKTFETYDECLARIPSNPTKQQQEIKRRIENSIPYIKINWLPQVSQ